MKEDVLESICAALSISFCDDLEHQNDILQRFSDIVHLKDSLIDLRQKCQRFQTYTLDIKPSTSSSSTTQILYLIVFEKETCTQHLLKPGEWNKIDIGKFRDVQLKFVLGNGGKGETKKVIARSASLLKKVGILSDKKSEEQLNLNQIQLGTNIKKSITLACGKSISFEMKLTRNDHRNLIKSPEFEDFLEITRCVHEWQAQNSEETDSYDGNLGDPTFSMFYSIAFFFEIPSFVLKVAEMTCFLVWDDEKKKLDDKALSDVSMKMMACESEVDSNHPSLPPCLVYLNECTCDTIRSILSNFSNDRFVPPISLSRLKSMNDSLKIVADICVLSIWDDFPKIPTPSTFLASEIQNLLEKSAEKWANCLEEEDLDLPKLCAIIQEFWIKMSEESQSCQLFFQQFDINYIQIVLLKIVEKLSTVTPKMLNNYIDAINVRNNVELENFTRLSMRLFVNFRRFQNLGYDFKLRDSKWDKFEEWFDNIPIFWTFSWREVTLKMVERTVRLDEDGDSVKYGARRPLPAGLYSFLCIQKGISDDLHRLEFTNSKHLVTCSTSVVNILCQNINAYAKKLFSEAMRWHDERASRLIRATNGIEQAMCFVEEGIKRFAQFQRLEQFVDEDEFVAVSTTSQRLLTSTRSMCEQQISTLLTQFVKLKNDIVARIARNLCGDGKETSNGFTSYMREIGPAERIEGTLECSYGLVDDVRCLLLPNCFKIATRHFANSLESEVRKSLKQRQPADYYSNIYIALKCIYEILEIDENKDVELLSNLHLNSFSTQDLILSYYDSLCEKIERTDFGATPTVDVHISYNKLPNETISIQIKLVKMSPMEWIDILSDRVDYFVRFELLPQFLFPPNKFESPTTNPMPQSTRPQWKQLFEINLPLDCFFTRGTCLAISVFDHERFVDRLVGRGFISLHSVPQSSDEKPSHRLRIPLLPNDYLDHSNVFYQLLKCRSSRDSVAKEFIEMRQKRHFRIGDIPRYIRKNRNRVGHMLLG